MAECLGLCDYEDDICLGCGRDFSQIDPPQQDKAAPPAENAALPDAVPSQPRMSGIDLAKD